MCLISPFLFQESVLLHFWHLNLCSRSMCCSIVNVITYFAGPTDYLGQRSPSGGALRVDPLRLLTREDSGECDPTWAGHIITRSSQSLSWEPMGAELVMIPNASLYRPCDGKLWSSPVQSSPWLLTPEDSGECDLTGTGHISSWVLPNAPVGITQRARWYSELLMIPA